MMKIKNVIWDWNGTLLDDLKAVVTVNNEMLSERGLPGVTTQFYLENFDFPVKSYYELTGFDLKKESFEEVASEYMSRYMKLVPECPLQEGARECLESFKEAGMKQFILSAKEEVLLRDTVPKYDIDNYFIDIAGIGSVTAHGKIDRGIQLINKHNIDPSECIFIGDTTHDQEVAQHFKMKAVLQTRGHHSRERLLAKCPHVYDNLLDIRDFILQA